MTRLSRFKFLTKFLALARFSRQPFQINLPAVSLSMGQQDERTYSFTIPSQAGAIMDTQITIDGNTYLGCYYADQGMLSFIIELYQTSSTSLQARVIRYNNGSTTTAPAKTISIKVSLFKPPNVF